MANYETRFALAISTPTKEEKLWWDHVVELISTVSDYENADDMKSRVTGEDLEIYNALTDENGNFSWGIDLSAVLGPATWFDDSDGEPNLDALAKLLQLFLKKFQPKNMISFLWAATCSKPRLDGFGGGVCAVTAEDIVWCTTSQVEEYLKRVFQNVGHIALPEDFE